MVTVTNCKPGELVIQAPQCKIEEIVREMGATGIVVRRQGESQSQSSVSNMKPKPASGPLGVPVWNFEKKEAKPKSEAQPVTNGKPKPGSGSLGIPTLRF